MALQIKGKFVENAAIDGDKIKLKSGQSLKQEKADGSVIDLVKLDESITSGSKVVVAGEQVASASEVAAEKARAEAAEAELASDIAQEVSDRAAAVSAEEAARIAGDAATLASANSYTDSQVAALVNSAPAVLDTLKELADAIADDPNFATTVAGQIGTVQANLTAEINRATAAEAGLASDLAVLAGQINDVADMVAAEALRAEAAEAVLSTQISVEQARAESVEAALDGRLDVIEGSGAGSIAKAQSDAQAYADAAVLVEKNRAEGVEAGLASDIAAETSARQAADTLIATSAQAAINAEADARVAADAALDVRVDTLEARLHRKMKFVLTSTDLSNGYVELGHEAMANSIVASVGRLLIHEGVGEDFTVSVVAGKTRMTFVGNLVAPSEEQLSVGDVLFVKYMNV